MNLLAPGHFIDRLRSALIDPARRESTVLLSLALYVLLWTIYGTIAKSSQGLHPDMTEVIAWSRDLAWGYKHPPLAAAIVWLWFGVFPLAEWSYYLLAMLMPAIALWIAWRLSADYLDIEKRIVGLALLMFIPFFNFHALKFNVNTVLMPLWAATTFWFLRSYKSRNALYAALAGLGAAGCMLGKYWSVFLLAGLVLAALVDKRRADYFRSAAPWITIIVGAIVLSPHVGWLLRNNFSPFKYALYVHGDKPFTETALATLGYLAGSAAYVAIPVIIVLLAARPSRKTIADMAWPADSDRRLVAAVFWGPLLLPALAALVSGTEITSLWSMSAWTLLPLLLLSPPAVTVKEMDTRRILMAAVLLPLVMLLVSPAIAIGVQRNGPPAATAQANLLAGEVERLWHQTMPLPLRFVGGDGGLADGVISYAVERPRALPDMPPPDAAELLHSGQVIVCYAEDASCKSKASGQNPEARRVETEIVRNFLRFPGKLQGYTIFIVPPRP
jgi:4-amino-4-deoxy-L-arabinose transferase-like glycosyltransferase